MVIELGQSEFCIVSICLHPQAPSWHWPYVLNVLITHSEYVLNIPKAGRWRFRALWGGGDWHLCVFGASDWCFIPVFMCQWVFLGINPQRATVRRYVDGKPPVMLLWRQVAHLSVPLILICQWRLSWRQREGQREEDWAVFAPLPLHYGVIPLLKRKIRSSLNYLKPILHFTCLTGRWWGEVGRTQGRENLNKSIHAETFWPFNQLFLKKRRLQHFTHRVMDGGRPEHFLCPIPLDNLADEWAPDWQVWYISARCVTRFNLLTRRLNSSHLSWPQLFSINGTVRRQSFKTALLCSNTQTTCWYCCYVWEFVISHYPLAKY